MLAPLEHTGQLDLADQPVELTPELLVDPAPGHTPGHQVVLIDSGDEHAVIAGDIANHPVMLLQPGVNGDTDDDPDLAASTRATMLERIGREERVVMTAHLPQPFGRFVPDGSRHLWVPTG